MQKIDIHLPPDDPIDLWDFTRLIAKSICPSLREVKNHTWLQRKREKLPNSDFETASDITADERAWLLRLLPELPSQAGMSKGDREMFMDAYLKHPERLPWSPVFVTEEEVTANGFKILQIQEKHLLALQQEIASGQIVAVDEHHISETRAGKNIFIRREDALRYLEQQRLQTAEDRPLQTAASVSKRAPSSIDDVAPRLSQPPTKSSKPRKTEATPVTPAVGTAVPDASDAAQSTGSFNPHHRPFSRNSPAPAPPPKGTSAAHQKTQDTHSVQAPLVILRRKQVEVRTSLSRSAIYDRLDPSSPRHDPTFPKQIKLSASSIGWVEAEIDNWLRSRLGMRK